MGIRRAGRYKRRATGGRRHVHVKCRKFEMARTPAGTKLGANKVKAIRVMGGNKKYRALTLDSGNFSWGTEVRACGGCCGVYCLALRAGGESCSRRWAVHGLEV